MARSCVLGETSPRVKPTHGEYFVRAAKSRPPLPVRVSEVCRMTEFDCETVVPMTDL